MFAYSPFGHAILGTAEVIEATAETKADAFHVRADGKIGYEHCGETNVWWDSSETKVDRGHPVFIDEDGDEWPADQLILSADDTAPDFYLIHEDDPAKSVRITNAAAGGRTDFVFSNVAEALPKLLEMNRAAEIARDEDVES